MADNKIHPKYIGTSFKLPVWTTCIVWLMIDRLQPSGVVTGVIWTIYGFLALGMMVAPFTQTWYHPTELPKK